MTSPRLAIVIVTWNRRDDVLACLDSLRGQLGPRDSAIVVDNGSHDGTEAAVRAAHPWAELVQTGANLGFAGGNNVGLRIAMERRFEWVLVLNADTAVPAGAIDALLAHASSRPGAAAFQPLLVASSDEGRIDGAGHVLFRCPGVIDALAGRPVSDAPRGAAPIFGACGAAALVRVSALAQVGLFDESLFLLCEDVDLMFRLRLAGHDVELVPWVRVRHRRGISAAGQAGADARRRQFWLDRNTVALALRYWPARWVALFAPVLLWRAARALRRASSTEHGACGRLWSSSLAVRAGNRRAMRRLGLDGWFAVRPGAGRPIR